ECERQSSTRLTKPQIATSRCRSLTSGRQFSMSANACLRQLSWWSSVTRSRTGPAPIKARTTLRGPPVASSEMAWPEIAACVLFLGHVAIGEGLQVGDDGELLPVVQ